MAGEVLTPSLSATTSCVTGMVAAKLPTSAAAQLLAVGRLNPPHRRCATISLLKILVVAVISFNFLPFPSWSSSVLIPLSV